MNNNNNAIDNEKCAYLTACAFLDESQKEMPELAEKLKNSYCMKNYRACARTVVHEVLGQVAVPDQMMPHQSLWAEQILTDAGKGSYIYNNDRNTGKDKDKDNGSQ